MKSKLSVILVIVLLLIVGCTTTVEEKMELQSSAFNDNELIPSRYTCDGENVSPPLLISNPPEDTKSFVLIMDDPDAVKPAGKVWDHWIVFNMPPDTREIPEGEEPRGSQGTTSNGEQKYGGPCPPDGEHKYFFKLYALDQKLDLFAGVTKTEVEQAMEGHIIEQTELTGRYDRVK